MSDKSNKKEDEEEKEMSPEEIRALKKQNAKLEKEKEELLAKTEEVDMLKLENQKHREDYQKSQRNNHKSTLRHWTDLADPDDNKEKKITQFEAQFLDRAYTEPSLKDLAAKISKSTKLNYENAEKNKELQELVEELTKKNDTLKQSLERFGVPVDPSATASKPKQQKPLSTVDKMFTEKEAKSKSSKSSKKKDSDDDDEDNDEGRDKKRQKNEEKKKAQSKKRRARSDDESDDSDDDDEKKESNKKKKKKDKEEEEEDEDDNDDDNKKSKKSKGKRERETEENDDEGERKEGGEKANKKRKTSDEGEKSKETSFGKDSWAGNHPLQVALGGFGDAAGASMAVNASAKKREAQTPVPVSSAAKKVLKTFDNAYDNIMHCLLKMDDPPIFTGALKQQHGDRFLEDGTVIKNKNPEKKDQF